MSPHTLTLGIPSPPMKEHSLYLGGSLHHLSDVDHSELLKEVEECSVEVLTAVLGEVGIRHVHQLQHSAGARGQGGCSEGEMLVGRERELPADQLAVH